MKRHRILGWNFIFYLVLLLSFLIAISVNGQQSRLLFESFSYGEGLHAGLINDVLEDDYGFLWVGTSKGVHKYNGYEFQPFIADSNDSCTIFGNNVTVLLEAQQGYLWVGTTLGLNLFKRQDLCFARFSKDKDPFRLSDGRVNTLLKIHNGNILIGTPVGLAIYNYADGRITSVFRNQDKSPKKGQPSFMSLLEDSNGHIWAGLPNGVMKVAQVADLHENPEPQLFTNKKILNVRHILEVSKQTLLLATENGLWYFHTEEKTFTQLPLPENLGSIYCQDLLEYDDAIWVATRGDGLLKLDSDGFLLNQYMNNPLIEWGLSDNHVRTLAADSYGILWAGTFSGLNKTNFVPNNFPIFQLDPDAGQNSNFVMKIHQDRAGGIWFYTRWRGLFYSKNLGTKARKMDFPLNEFLVHKGVSYIYSDSENTVWVSRTSDGIYKYNAETRSFSKPNMGDTINSISIAMIEEDVLDPNFIWLGTYEGLCRINKTTYERTWYFPSDGNPDFHSNRIIYFKQSSSGIIWANIGDYANNKMAWIDPETRKFNLISSASQEAISKFDGKVNDMAVSSQGNVWIATPNGLVKIDGKTKEFFFYTTKNGLVRNLITNVEVDKTGKVWFFGDQHIYRMDPVKEDIWQFHVPEVISFVEGCSSMGPDGQILVGGRNGICAFDPETVWSNPSPRRVLITDIKISNTLLNGEMVTRNLNEIVLNYPENDISFEFVSLDLLSPKNIQYAFKMDGYKDDWIYVGNQRTANYTNLDGGRYTFRVKAANADGIWNEDERQMEIIIHPPWWRTDWAYFLYFLLGATVFFLIYHFQLNRQLIKAETHRLKELDEMKTRLYTNITHEFRTPLTVILGISDKIFESSKGKMKEGADMIRRNGQQLLQLINQMLDLSKLKSGGIEASYIYGDIIQYLNYCIESFHSLAKSKNIRLHFLPGDEVLVMDYDPDKLRKIISNLLSNAIKFTPEGGDVYISAGIKQNESTFQHQTQDQATQGSLVLTVKDTGKGIPEEQISYVFDRFQQIEDSTSKVNEGTGIGLTLVKELVKVMNGTIDLKSKIGVGTEFTVILPVLNLAKVIEKTEFPEPTEFNRQLSEEESLPSLLIIEDNADVVWYIVSCLEKVYSLSIASNGKEGIEKAIETVPDLIISDVMMPEKNGFEVCATLKADELTSHIPIILLTAKAGVESILEGYEHGADDYLPKPFNEKILLARLRNLLELRKNLRAKYNSEYFGQVLPETMEDEFIIRFRELIENHLDDADYNLPRMCRDLAISRVHLFRKIKALTGMPPSQYVRKYRLQKAKNLLLTTELTISEIAYEVGFRDPAYFSRTFKEVYSISPNETRK